MHSLTRSTTLERPAALTALFVRYVTGQIEEPTWKRVSGFVDSSSATAEEREAMAAFAHDAVVELGADLVKLPTTSEARAVLKEIRC